jgi:hypothetical protein
MNKPTSAGRKPPSLGIGQFLFVAVLAVILFLLGQSPLLSRWPGPSERFHRAIAGTEKVLIVARMMRGYTLLDVKNSGRASHLRQLLKCQERRTKARNQLAQKLCEGE